MTAPGPTNTHILCPSCQLTDDPFSALNCWSCEKRGVKIRVGQPSCQRIGARPEIALSLGLNSSGCLGPPTWSPVLVQQLPKRPRIPCSCWEAFSKNGPGGRVQGATKEGPQCYSSPPASRTEYAFEKYSLSVILTLACSGTGAQRGTLRAAEKISEA